MKSRFIYIVLFLITFFACHAQKAPSGCDVVVFTEQGWILKAQNNGQQNVAFRFTYITEGRDQAGEVVSTAKEQSEYLELGPGETMQVLTAPKDPQNKIKYTFKNIVITECSTKKPSVNSRGINTRMNGGN